MRVGTPCFCFTFGESMGVINSSLVHSSLQAFLPMICGVAPPTVARSVPCPGPLVIKSSGSSLRGKLFAAGSRTPSFDTSVV